MPAPQPSIFFLRNDKGWAQLVGLPARTGLRAISGSGTASELGPAAAGSSPAAGTGRSSSPVASPLRWSAGQPAQAAAAIRRCRFGHTRAQQHVNQYTLAQCSHTLSPASSTHAEMRKGEGCQSHLEVARSLPPGPCCPATCMQGSPA